MGPGPSLTGSRAISYVALGVALLIALGPFFATLFVAILVRQPFAFGSEGLVAASTVRIKPSQTPPWNGNTNWKKYPPNLSIPGYRHCFFYKDEDVINDVATWIRLNAQSASCPVLEQAAKPNVAAAALARIVGAVRSRWFTLAAPTVVMTALFIWSYIGDMREFNTPKFDLSSDSTSIKDSAAPALEIDEALAAARYPPTGIYVSGVKPYVDVDDDIRDIGLDGSLGTNCVIEGNVIFSAVGMLLKIYVYENDTVGRNRRSVQLYNDWFSDGERNVIWKWDSDHGREVHFRRRFRYDPAPPVGRLALGLRNWENWRENVEAKVYVKCS